MFRISTNYNNDIILFVFALFAYMSLIYAIVWFKKFTRLFKRFKRRTYIFFTIDYKIISVNREFTRYRFGTYNTWRNKNSIFIDNVIFYGRHKTKFIFVIIFIENGIFIIIKISY